MARCPSEARRFPAVHVVAAIMHGSGRVLVVQRTGDDGWQPPAGNVEPPESVIAAARRHVRRASGFEITDCLVLDTDAMRSESAAVVRCRVKGVGSDIAPDVRALRWIGPADVMLQPDAAWRDGLLRAFQSTPSANVSTAIEQAAVLVG